MKLTELKGRTGKSTVRMWDFNPPFSVTDRIHTHTHTHTILKRKNKVGVKLLKSQTYYRALEIKTGINIRTEA